MIQIKLIYALFLHSVSSSRTLWHAGIEPPNLGLGDVLLIEFLESVINSKIFLLYGGLFVEQQNRVEFFPV